MAVFRIVRHHGEHASRSPEIEADVESFLFEEIEGVDHSGVFLVSDVEDAAGDEGVSRFASRVAGVDVLRYGERFLV